MYFNLESTLTGIFISSVLILIICLIAGKNRSFDIFSVDAILVALGLSLIRAFFPLEYWNSFLINVPVVLTTIFRVLEYPILTLTLGYTIETYHVLGMIWIIGSICYLFKFVKINRDILRFLKLIEKKYGFYKTDSRKKLLEDLKCQRILSVEL